MPGTALAVVGKWPQGLGKELLPDSFHVIVAEVDKVALLALQGMPNSEGTVEGLAAGWQLDSKVQPLAVSELGWCQDSVIPNCWLCTGGDVAQTPRLAM